MYNDIKKRIRRRKLRFRMCMLLIITCTATIYLFTTPVIKVKDIIVEGNVVCTEDKIIELSGIEYGDNLLRLNMREITQNVLTNSYIESCDIKRTLFGNIYISVQERQSAAISTFGEDFVTIDKKGVVIEVLDSVSGISLPAVEGLDITEAIPGKTMVLSDERKLNVFLKIFDNIAKDDFSAIIKGIDMNNLMSIIIKTAQDINIKLGSIENIEYKIKVSRAILEQDDSIKGLKGTIDVSFDGNPVFRQE
ncbi:cell division protein FtsQ [Oxobacter pfennigii]|uniref:Cell division protein FtsQ n=1 Tax=Oxobacter pfennigii TaxID=36849 RepID=A0A0P9AFA1_9CLOT|nr:FtsQ-type POTRA domain-containing protein [Oxobacter pfennigii]KPU44037.1 cell division protein FtsQ [Oxobacter pfennigii]